VTTDSVWPVLFRNCSVQGGRPSGLRSTDWMDDRRGVDVRNQIQNWFGEREFTPHIDHSVQGEGSSRDMLCRLVTQLFGGSASVNHRVGIRT